MMLMVAYRNKFVYLLLLLTNLSPIAAFSLLKGQSLSNRLARLSRQFPPAIPTSTTSSLAAGSDSVDDITQTFPIATLLENAKALDDNLKNGEKLGRYADSTWSNRLGTVLTPAAIGVYTCDRPFYWNKIDVGGRMSVIQLDDGNLWVHSPLNLDQATRTALNKLGTVKYIVSPNYEHLKYAKQWSKEYPEAFMWGCPGLGEVVPEIEWEGEIPRGLLRPSESHQLKNCWDFDFITPLHLDMETNPFTGKAFFNEVIFYHRPSKSLFTTDIFWNYPQEDGVANSHLLGNNYDGGLAPNVSSIPLGSRLWKIGMDKIYLPFYKKFMINDRKYYDEAVKVVLEEWDVETLIPCHGDIIRGKEKIEQVLAKHFLVN
mmetsp:Transcript_47000/g.69622  ORF Transcript_47000/g.69622 Transcript_47000/m.69622 type:complete len:373 (+) Transcript_47000:57-1175(+)